MTYFSVVLNRFVEEVISQYQDVPAEDFKTGGTAVNTNVFADK